MEYLYCTQAPEVFLTYHYYFLMIWIGQEMVDLYWIFSKTMEQLHYVKTCYFVFNLKLRAIFPLTLILFTLSSARKKSILQSFNMYIISFDS